MRDDVLGRAAELRQISHLLSRARNGRGGALLLAGDAGIGKTTLLDAATEQLDGVRVVRVDGYEAESTAPFAAVQRLVRPLRAHLSTLPEQHQHALAVASGQSVGVAPDRFLVGLSLLTLLGEAGAVHPVVCVVDDAHLLDPESLDALAFVGRRVEAESASLLLAGRDGPSFSAQVAGVPTLRLTGLPTDAAVRLLVRSMPAQIDPAVAVQVAAATGGNPLALVDLAGELTIRRLAGSSFGDEPLPIGRHLEQLYLRQVRELEPDVQVWLLVAAADSTGNIELISSAARDLGLADDVADAAEAAGLVELGRAVHFRHPLVRSAAYHAASGKERRRVHRVLSSIADTLELTERAAWHAAKATLGSDEEVALRLERVADLAAARGGYASRARVLVEASALTPAGGRKGARLVQAAEAALVAGTGQLAKSLLDEIDENLLDPVSRGRLLVVGASYSLFAAAPTVTRASAQMLAAADLFHGERADLEQETLIRAWEAALPSERLTVGVDWLDLGRRLDAGATVRDGPAATILRAISALILKPYAEAVPLMREALRAFDAMDTVSLLAHGHSSVALACALWDVDARHRILERWAGAARDAGALQLLDNALWVLSLSEMMGGTPRQAVQYMDQVRELRRAIGYDAEHVVNVAVLAWSGVAPDEVAGIAQATYAIGFGGVHSSAMSSLATVDIAEGRYADGYERLKPFVDNPFFHVTPLMWPDFVEASIRSDHREDAVTTVEQLEARAEACGTPWARGVAARSRGLLNDDHPPSTGAGPETTESHFLTAIAHLETCRALLDLGRAHLVYGEWLRRSRRRGDARTHLRRAVEIFEGSGAPSFAARAQRELAAAGDLPLSAASPRTMLDLTQQERTVAELAAAGRTNAEIGATMFLSINTVDYHLRKIFQRLEISSRRQLRDRLGGA